MTAKYKPGGVTVTIGKSQDISLPARVFRGRATCMHFDTDKSFLLPPSIAGMRNIVSFFNRHQDKKMLVNGHTDLVGDAQYNLQLSNERAAAVVAYLLDDVETWLAWYHAAISSKRWSVLEDQYMLQTIKDSSGKPYYRGLATGYANPDTRNALKQFQTDNGRKADGTADDDTRRALIGKYMALEGTSLPKGTPIVRHGCGKFHPIDPTAAADQGNRRVEIFLFEGAVDPPPQATCPSPGCVEYRQWVGNPDEDVDLCSAADLLVIVEDAASPPNRISSARVTIDRPDSAPQTTDKDGTTTFLGIAAGKVHVNATFNDVTRSTDVDVKPGVAPQAPAPRSGGDRASLVDAQGNQQQQQQQGQNSATVQIPTPRLRMSLFDFNPSFGKSQKWERGKLVGVNFDTALLDKLRDARIDDYSLVHTIAFKGAPGGTANKPDWDFIPLGEARLRVDYLLGLISEMHSRDAQVIAGYEVVDPVDAPTDTPAQKAAKAARRALNAEFVQWMKTATTAQVTQHANDIIAFFASQTDLGGNSRKIDIDGIGFDIEMNGFGGGNTAVNLEALFTTLCKSFKVVYYDTGPFQPDDGKGSTPNMSVLSYALSGKANNLIARPMCYANPSLPVSSNADVSASIDCALKPPPGGGVTSAHVQMAIDVSRHQNIDDLCTTILRPKLTGMVIYTMPGGGAQTTLLTNAKGWESKLNPGTPGPSLTTSGQPVQAPNP